MKNSITLRDIIFPVFVLKGGRPTIEGGLSFYEISNDGGHTFIKKIIDDRSVEGNSLAKRRLKIPKKTLQTLNQAVFFIGDFIKIAKPSIWFIDSSGAIFNYTKTTVVPLLCRKIEKNINSNTMGSLLKLEDIPSRFKTLFKVLPSHKYGLVLKTDYGYILYGTTEDRVKDTRRKI